MTLTATSTAQDIREKITELRPWLRDHQAQAERERRIPQETIERIDAAGVFALTKPKRFGGADFTTRDIFDIFRALGSGCGATAWVVWATAGGNLWSFAFQSESPTGEPWLGPDILDHLGELAANGVRDVVLCPVGFVADHLEIRWDLDTEAADRARELGIELRRIEMPNADPALVRVLAGLARNAAALPSRA